MSSFSVLHFHPCHSWVTVQWSFPFSVHWAHLKSKEFLAVSSPVCDFHSVYFSLQNLSCHLSSSELSDPLRHSFPHASFVLICGFLFLFTSLQLRGSSQFLVLPPHSFRYVCCLSFPQDRSSLGFWYSLLRLYLEVLLCCSIISSVAAQSSHSAFSVF